MPLGRADSGLVIHILRLAGGIYRSSCRIVRMSTGHWSLTHVVSKVQTLGEVVRIEGSIRRRRVFVLLRSVSSKRSLGICCKSIVVGHAILRANMLQNLLVDVQLRSSIGHPVLVVAERMPEVGLVVARHAAVAAVG